MSEIHTPEEPSFVPKAEKIYQIKEKHYQLSNTNYDIGEYLYLLNIKPYEIIIILVKKGIYKWEKPYSLPEGAKLFLNGENYKNGGKNNTVTIFMTEKHTDYNEELNMDFCAKNRLNIGNDSRVEICGINFIEKINDLRALDVKSAKIGIFSLNGRNSILVLQQCTNEVSTSPFINISAFAIGTVFINSWVCFNRNVESQENEIFIVDTNTGLNATGNKAVVIASSANTRLGLGCFFKKKENIEYHDSIENFMK